MKTLAIDPGTRRLGLAACDEWELTTRLLPVMEISPSTSPVGELTHLIRENNFQRILVGFPLNMNGIPGPAAKRAQVLAKSLQKECRRQELFCEVILWDERLTSFEAEARLREKGIPKRKAKNYLDSLAAEVLLEDYLRQSKQNPGSSSN